MPKAKHQDLSVGASGASRIRRSKDGREWAKATVNAPAILKGNHVRAMRQLTLFEVCHLNI